MKSSSASEESEPEAEDVSEESDSLPLASSPPSPPSAASAAAAGAPALAQPLSTCRTLVLFSSTYFGLTWEAMCVCVSEGESVCVCVSERMRERENGRTSSQYGHLRVAAAPSAKNFSRRLCAAASSP